MMAALHEARRNASPHDPCGQSPCASAASPTSSDPKNLGELGRALRIGVADAIYQVQIGGDLALSPG
jgi:hypothetical protein